MAAGVLSSFFYGIIRIGYFGKLNKKSIQDFCILQAGMTGVITSDCAVPYLDASYYAIILNSFLFVETGLI